MEHEDEGEFVLPPVELPRIPEAPVKKGLEVVVGLEDRFKEEILKVVESSIESL